MLSLNGPVEGPAVSRSILRLGMVASSFGFCPTCLGFSGRVPGLVRWTKFRKGGDEGVRLGDNRFADDIGDVAEPSPVLSFAGEYPDTDLPL